MEKTLKKHADKARFAIVGVANTGLDFIVLLILVAFGVPIIVANFFSTSVALVFSFFANKKFTFQFEGKHTRQQFASFLGITLFGLWIIQPIIIEGTRLLVSTFFPEKYTILTIGKIIATGVTLIWNYVLYKAFVFKKR